jgi:hypothetical protein
MIRWLRTDVGLAVVVVVYSVVVSAALVVSVVAYARITDVADRTTGSLCALRHDLEDRVANGERFLRDHPRGIPGIPAGTLRTSVDGQRRTVEALGDLRCP